MKINIKNQMANGIIKLSMVAIMVTGLFSCQKNFLEREPLDSISDAAVWNDVTFINAYVSEVYATLRAGWIDNSRLDISSDDGHGIEKDAAQLIQRGEATPSSMGYLLTPWTEYYRTITRCNKFLTNVKGENLELLESQNAVRINEMIGEMKFLRGYAYSKLLAFYGGVPIMPEDFELGDNYNLARNTYDEVLALVIADLDDAVKLLPLTWPAKDFGRITKGAALAIKSRALFYAASPSQNPTNDLAKWQKAADATKAVIDLNIYSLHPDYKELFMEKGNYSKEAIFYFITQQALKSSSEYRIELKMFPNGSGGWSHPSPTQNLIDSYEMKTGLLPKDDPAYDPQNPYVNRDPRFAASILFDGAPFKGRQLETFLPGGKDSNVGSEGWNASWTGYNIRKFIDENINTPNTLNTSNPNWMYIRYGEILLNYAEIQYNLGNEVVAREYLNKIRSRPSVMMPAVTTTGAALLKRIMNERRIELYAEEHRFFDIRRWKLTFPDKNLYRVNITKNLSTGKKTYSIAAFQKFDLPEKMYLAPIPQGEIEKAPALIQNPGY